MEDWRDLREQTASLVELITTSHQEKDLSLEPELNNKLIDLQQQFKAKQFLMLFNATYDSYGAIVSLHAGTGGVDAQDWTQMLERMYLRFAEKKGWATEVIDQTMGQEAGIKSCVLKISGRWAYGHLKAESGVHRLVRISPFDAEAMRQTSFALVEVIPELPAGQGVIIREEDLKMDFFRSSGPGGQNVNKTSSAVRITHLPTGLTVASQTERSQHQNRANALSILRSKLNIIAQEQLANTRQELRGEAQTAAWGKQIRSYVLQPYKLVKDHRTNYETSNVQAVLDGDLNNFIEAYLKNSKQV